MAEWKQILVRVKNEIASDHISVVSAGIAFYALLSVFPALAALISIAGLVLDPADIASQLDTVMALIPESAGAVLQEQVLKVTSGDETATGLVAALLTPRIATSGALMIGVKLVPPMPPRPSKSGNTSIRPHHPNRRG